MKSGESRGGLLVDSRAGLLNGGDGGAAIVPHDLEESPLWEAINWDGYEMPPSKKMPESVIANFKKWIEMGAPDPRKTELLKIEAKITQKQIEEGKKHWSLLPPKTTKGSTIDRLVAKKMSEAGLKPAKPADAYTLLRRMNFDLVGLPPSPKETETFQKAWRKNRDAAVSAKVDELLSRPQYGERWGRHWLDVARYAESSGSRNVTYPHAWRYRDYVIDSLNDDTPYDRFISEQIAGDLLPVKTDKQWQKNLIATGFLAIGMKHHGEKNPRKFMADMVDEQIDTMTQSVLGLTVSCARCHDHKSDPIPTSDYYAMAGIFLSTKTYYGTLRIGQNHRPSDLLLLPIEDDPSTLTKRRPSSITELQERVKELDHELAGLRGKDAKKVRNSRNRIAGLLASLKPDGTPKTFAMGVQESAEMIDANVLFGGEVDHPAQKVSRGFVQVLGDLNFTVKDNKTSGRLELAKAMTSKTNPLTARVMVNRIWMHLLGRPLVGTPSNFGVSGMDPENLELLDYLAVQFMNESWSIKKLIREIVLSDVYRRSSQFNKANYAVDPDNKMLWRANTRQIDAEAMRDAMLTFSGRINLTRPVGSVISIGAGRPNSVDSNMDTTHRSIYLPIIRDRLPNALTLFGFPNPNFTSEGRSESIIPTQALFMMNSEFVTAQSYALAAVLKKKHPTTVDQVKSAFLRVYGRPARMDELKASSQFFHDFKPSDSADSPMTSVKDKGRRRDKKMFLNPEDQALAVFCQALMASADFRILN